MGEQVATKEEANNKEESPAPAAAPEAAPAPAPAEEKKDEAPPPADQDPKKDEAAPPPPPVPVILGVEVHCTGCAKRIRRSLLRCKGVEAVHVDMAANQVTIKGAVDPQALCARLRAKTKRDATLISPLPPPPPPPPEGEEPPPPPPPPPPLVSEARTVELLVNMHCEACAQQLQSKMMKMKGVVSAETNLAAGKLTLSATVEDEKIVEYIHRRTGKIASVVPPPPPEPPKEEELPAAAAEPSKEETPADADGKKEEAGENKPAEDGKGAAEAGEEKKEGGGGAGEEDQKPGKQEGVAVDGFPPEEMMKRMVYWPYGGAPGGGIHYKLHPADAEEAMMARRMAMHAMPPPLPPPPHHHHHHNPYAMMHQQHHQWAPPPPPPPPGMPMYNNYNYGGSSYMMERPPQMFSDENPNACVIS